MNSLVRSLRSALASAPQGALRTSPSWAVAASASARPLALRLHSFEFSTSSESKSSSEQPKDAQSSTAAKNEQQQQNAGESKEPTLEQTKATLQEMRENYLRALADAENTRRIASIDIQNARSYAIQSFAKSLLDVADNLSMALAFVPKDGTEAQKKLDASMQNLIMGLRMTETEMYKTFQSQGISKFGKVGEPFDPKIHNALYIAEPGSTPIKEPNTIAAVIKSGYMLKDRVLRPAQVSCTPAAPASNSTSGSNGSNSNSN